MKKHFTFSSSTKKYLLLGLLVVVLAGSAIWLKYFSPYAPEPLFSSANEEPPHWAHSVIPFEMTLKNYAGASWERSLVTAESKWEIAGAYNYKHSKELDPSFRCYPVVLPVQVGMNVCAINADNDWVAIGGYGTGSEDPTHINGGIIILNDFYLNTLGSMYNTDIWRNHITCRFLGWTMGAPYRADPPELTQSCMNILPEDMLTPKTMQNPDAVDLANIYELYNHVDSESKAMNSSVQETLARSLKSGDLGPITQSLNGGKIELHELDLGDGYVFHSMIQKK